MAEKEYYYIEFTTLNKKPDALIGNGNRTMSKIRQSFKMVEEDFGVKMRKNDRLSNKHTKVYQATIGKGHVLTCYIIDEKPLYNAYMLVYNNGFEKESMKKLVKSSSHKH